LLRWMNYHLKNAGSDKRVTNWSGDVKDSVAYTIVLNQIAPGLCDKAALNNNNMDQRAGMVIKNAEKLGVPPFIKAKDISSGNARLNLAFAAQIFNTNPGLEPLTEEEKAELAGMMNDDVGDSREERAFRMWMNTLGIPDLYINGLFEDCKDGLALLKVEDFVEPGVVDWTKCEMKPNNKFKKLTNCNCAVDTGKKMHFSLVGIGGSDVNDGNKKLLLALVWQLMRYHTIKFLSHLTMDGSQVTDDQIIEWANKKVADAGRPSSMRNFKDKTLSTSHFFFDLLHGVTPDIINWDLVTGAGPLGSLGVNHGVLAVSRCRNPVRSETPARSARTAPSTARLLHEPPGWSGRPAVADSSPGPNVAGQSAMLAADLGGSPAPWGRSA
jgi:plastin-1